VRLRLPNASRTGEELRNARIRCGYDVVSVARELGVPPGDLRALEWERMDLLGDRYAAKLLSRYVDWLEPEDVPRPIKGGREPQPES
jgi:helix-turn-helix protein